MKPTTPLHLFLLAIAALSPLGCLGGQSNQAKKQSAPVGDRSDVPKSTLAERDWKQAARGHGAAGLISAEELARMDAKSAPGRANRSKQ